MKDNWFTKNGEYRYLIVGFVVEGEDWTICDDIETREQLEWLKENCTILGMEVSWKDLDDPEEKRTFGQAIEHDRLIRKSNCMADRPLCLVIWLNKDNEIHRIEAYQGHNSLEKCCDVKSSSYIGPNDNTVKG